MTNQLNKNNNNNKMYKKKQPQNQINNETQHPELKIHHHPAKTVTAT